MNNDNLKIECKKVYDKYGNHKSIIRAKQANIAQLERKGFKLFFPLEVLDSIDLYLIPVVLEGKYGFVNKMASIVIDPIFDEIKGAFYTAENYVVVRKGHRWSVIDSTGKELLPYVYTKIFASPDSSLVTCCDYDGKSIIDLKTGNILVNSGIYDIIEGFRYGFTRVKKGDNWGIINSKGEIVLETEYYNIFPWYEWYEATTKVQKSQSSNKYLLRLEDL